MVTHDYTEQYWGHALSNIEVKGKNVISMLGFGYDVKKNDVITMNMTSGRVGKFKVLKIEFFSDPNDMFKAEAEFTGYTEETS